MIAALFDIDGTLIQTGGAGQLAFAETFADVFGVAQISAEVKFAGRSDRAIASELMEVHGLEPSPENWRRFHDAYLQRLPAALERRTGQVLPGVVELLDVLGAESDCVVGLLTGNVVAGARTKLGYYGLADRFPFGGFGDELLDRNDIAAAALAAAHGECSRAGRVLSGAIVIGDTEHDVRCARAIGAVAVAVPTGGATREALAATQPDMLLDDLSDAAPLLQAVRRGLAA
ncbi:MAG TPA: HAD family hydrolase [Lacipirellulaceae bacterium]|nr:HAD family hydrolase [Lacipirellulaceae bacterium]